MADATPGCIGRRAVRADGVGVLDVFIEAASRDRLPGPGPRGSTAMCSTVPATEVVTLASIFIASIVATTSPASTCWPLETRRVATPVKGAPISFGSSGFGALGGGRVAHERPVADRERPELAVQRADDVSHAALVGVADRLEAEEQLHARSEVDGELLAVLEAEEERRGGERREVAVGGERGLVLSGRTREEQPAERDARASGRRGRAASSLGDDGLFEHRLATSERPGAERLGPAVLRHAELAGEEAQHGVGDVEALRLGGELVGIGVRGGELEREVADDLGGGRDLDDASEDPVGRCVEPLDVLEAVAEADGLGLLAKVGELAAGDLVLVDAPGRSRKPALEGRVEAAEVLEVGLERRKAPRWRARSPVGGVRDRRDDRRERGLAGRARHRRRGAVDRVDADLERGEVGAELAAGGVVGVQVHRLVEALPERR